MRLSKTFTFEAAHKLPNYKGKCQRLHGHTYKVELVVEGERNESGMVLDFKVLSEIAKLIRETLDHSYLNDIIPNPTAENIAEWIYIFLSDQMTSCDTVFPYEVRVWETSTSCAVYTIHDWIRDHQPEYVPYDFEG